MLHNSSGSLHEQPAKVLVSTLWNLPQCLLASGRVFLGNHSQPGGEIAPFAKCRAVADRCDDRGCCYRTDSRHLHQPSTGLVLPSNLLNRLVSTIDLLG